MARSTADRIDQVKQYIASHQAEMLADLKQLVEIESPSDYPMGVDRVAEWMSAALTDLGFRVQTLPAAGYGSHLLADSDQPTAPRLLLCGHMDTVFPRGTGWPFSIQGDRAYGPGVSDMKSGLVSLVYALRGLAAAGEIPLAVRVFCNSEEEIGSPTSLGLIPDLIRGIDYACVLEPAEPDGTVIIRRKGIGKFIISVKGKAAHAGQQPELGINANRELAYQILAAEDLADPIQGTTLNAGRIEGGTAPYIISDWAQALVDARVWNSEEQTRIEQSMQNLTLSNRVEGTMISVSGGFHRPPMLPLAGTQRLMDALSTAAHLSDLDITFGGGGAASDGNNLVGAGVPTLDGMGPAGGRAHSHDEYLELKSFSERTVLLAGFMLVLGSSNGNH